MTLRTDVEVWPTDTPYVVFMVPSGEAQKFALLTKALIESAAEELGMDPDKIERMGLIAEDREHGIEGLYFLEELGVDPLSVTLLVLWGETANYIDFGSQVAENFGIGFTSFMRSGVVIPTIRMSFGDSDWWEDSLHQDYAVQLFVDMFSNGRVRPQVGDFLSSIYDPSMFN